MTRGRRWVTGALAALGLCAFAPAAGADEYFDNGLNSATGIGYVYQTRGPDQPTIVWWYDAYGNYGVAWYQ